MDQLRNSYEASKCVFYSEANASIDLSELQPNVGSMWHFTEVCLSGIIKFLAYLIHCSHIQLLYLLYNLSAQSINRICPNRAYVYERISSFKLDDPNAKEIEAIDKSDCENKCLTEKLFTCRSASFDSTAKKCYLSQQNRHVSPSRFKAESNYEYLENMCLKRKFFLVNLTLIYSLQILMQTMKCASGVSSSLRRESSLRQSTKSHSFQHTQ